MCDTMRLQLALSRCLQASLFSLNFIPLEQIAQTYANHATRNTIGIVFLFLALQTGAVDVRDNRTAIKALKL
jgi:hypothetical protein